MGKTKHRKNHKKKVLAYNKNKANLKKRKIKENELKFQKLMDEFKKVEVDPETINLNFDSRAQKPQSEKVSLSQVFSNSNSDIVSKLNIDNK